MQSKVAPIHGTRTKLMTRRNSTKMLLINWDNAKKASDKNFSQLIGENNTTDKKNSHHHNTHRE